MNSDANNQERAPMPMWKIIAGVFGAVMLLPAFGMLALFLIGPILPVAIVGLPFLVYDLWPRQPPQPARPATVSLPFYGHTPRTA